MVRTLVMADLLPKLIFTFRKPQASSVGLHSVYKPELIELLAYSVGKFDDFLVLFAIRTSAWSRFGTCSSSRARYLVGVRPYTFLKSRTKLLTSLAPL